MEDKCNKMDTLNSAESSGDDSDKDEDEDENMEREITKCLFCDNETDSVNVAIDHLKTNHHINLSELKQQFLMDQYSYIKMINYIRKEKPDPTSFHNLKIPFWDKEEYLKPGEYETWLTYDFESLPIEKSSNNSETIDNLANSSVEVVKLNQIIQHLTNQLKERDTLLEMATEDLAKMRGQVKEFLSREIGNFVDDDRPKDSIKCLSLKDDEAYFSGYSDYGIHREMLADKVRTSSYRNAILENSDFFKGKTVLDVGCGTSILSLFASQAGAKEIVAVDNSEIIYQAIDIAKRNNIENIRFVKGRLEDTELPIDKFDIIISEWMGYFLLFEGMLDSIIYARDRHLKPDGMLMPNRCNISLVGYGDEEAFNNRIAFWDNVYGFDMSIMKEDALKEAIVDNCNPNNILTERNVLIEYNLSEISLNYSTFSYEFQLKVKKTGRLTSFVSYFDIFFDLPKRVEFSTSPECERTHWKQVKFFINPPVEVSEGSIVSGKFHCKRNPTDPRALLVCIEVFGKQFKYHLN